jgi:hypothetical protein
MAIQAKRSDYITWDIVPEATSYEANLVDFSTQAVIVSVSVVDPRVKVGDLSAGQPAGQYGVKVRSHDGQEYSTLSPMTSLEVLLPDYPLNIRKE